MYTSNGSYDEIFKAGRSIANSGNDDTTCGIGIIIIKILGATFGLVSLQGLLRKQSVRLFVGHSQEVHFPTDSASNGRLF